MLYYCKKCGRIINKAPNSEKICDCCQSPVYLASEKYQSGEFDAMIPKNQPILWEELVKPSPEFNQYLFDHREEILSKKNAEFNRAMAIIDNAKAGKSVGKTTSVTCPYCKSTNTKKITNTSKAVHTAIFGIFSISRNSKQWHCNSCGSDF